MFDEGVAKVAPGRAPRLGEHTDEVFREIGVETVEIDRLRDLGALV